MGFDVTPRSQFTGDGYQGSVLAERCIDFNTISSFNLTAILIDGSGHKSNELEIKIPKPDGYDNCYAQKAQASGLDAKYADFTRLINLGKKSGTYQFEFNNKGDGADRIVLDYKGKVIFDTGCLEEAGSKLLKYDGISSPITVSVDADCLEPIGKSTWEFAVSCPK
jgi:hypothetical protein